MGVYRLPKHLDEEVARPASGQSGRANSRTLTSKQADYIGVDRSTALTRPSITAINGWRLPWASGLSPAKREVSCGRPVSGRAGSQDLLFYDSTPVGKTFGRGVFLSQWLAFPVACVPGGLCSRCFRSRRFRSGCFISRRLAGLPVLYFGRERARKSRRETGGFRYPVEQGRFSTRKSPPVSRSGSGRGS